MTRRRAGEVERFAEKVERFAEKVERFAEKVERFAEKVERFAEASSGKTLPYLRLGGALSAYYPDYPDYPKGVRELGKGRRPGLPGFARPVSVRETQAHSRRRLVWIESYGRCAGPTTGRLSGENLKREQVQHTSESLSLGAAVGPRYTALGPLRMGPALHVSRVPTPWTPRTPHPRAL